MDSRVTEAINRQEMMTLKMYCNACGARRVSWATARCLHCNSGKGFHTESDLRFAFDEDTGSYVFMATGCAELKHKNDRERHLESEPEEPYGLAEWYQELRLLGRAMELIAQGFKIGDMEIELFVAQHSE